ncbi:MAG: LuxR C-terminal-related transcriptional regulator [Candidatus Korobacteraceae bacterium]
MLRKQVGMQVQQIGGTHDVSRQPRRGLQSSLLLVGSEDAFNSEAARKMLGGHQFRVAGRATTLLEGLARLEFEPIDLVLVSLEFREEELSLFSFDAHRRGFGGLILHVASLPPHLREADFHGRVVDPIPRQRPVGSPRHTLGRPNSIQLDGQPDPVHLTSKEQAVMTGVADGQSNLQIARKLNCSEGSVKAVLQQLFGKLGVRKRAQIVRLAFESPLMRARSGARENVDQTPPRGPTTQLPPRGDPKLPEMPVDKRSLVEVGDFVMETYSHRVWVRGKGAQLSAREFKLLLFLSKRPQELLRHNDLVSALGSSSQPVSRESLRAMIQAVRGKIEPASPPRYIVTEPFQGYRFIPSP